MIQPQRVIPLALAADAESRIQRQTFRGETFVGPAVLALIDNVTMDGCTFNAPDPDAVMIEVPEGKIVVGVIGLSQVTFDRCVFHNVAVIGTREQLDLFRKAWVGGGNITQPSGSLPGQADPEAVG